MSRSLWKPCYNIEKNFIKFFEKNIHWNNIYSQNEINSILIIENDFISICDNNIEFLRENMISVSCRSQTITPEYEGLVIKIYNGIRFYKIFVIDKMFGKKFGEFSSTRRYPIHKKKKKKK